MSLKIYLDDLEKLILECVEIIPKIKIFDEVPFMDDDDDLLTSSRKLEEDFLELVTDVKDLGYSNDLENFARKLEGLVDEYNERRGYGRPDTVSLLSVMRRSDRVMRTQGSSMLRSNEVVFQPIESKSSSKAVIEPVHNLLPSAQKITNEVFVVHGHDDATLHSVCRLITSLGLIPVVLREKPNRGATVIEKFEINANVGFAVVLMTADDVGGSNAEAKERSLNPRARQNVVMELGYFIGKLGRPRVAVLKTEAVEKPSDILGVVYTPIDKYGAWRTELAKELKSAGYEVDLNQL